MASALEKALQINQDERFYGSFAEIGAGQEVARHFFQAGLASKTIAKSISAYDMTFSDEIYGKGDRYVSESRLMKMLSHEYDLLIERLSPTRGKSTCFFSFAETVATSSKVGQAHSHGWIGVRFQEKPNGPANDVVVHLELLDPNRLLQQDALGQMGLNLLHAAFYSCNSMDEFINALTQNVNLKRVEIDVIRFSGDKFKDWDNRLVALKMVQKHLCKAALFDENGKVVQAGDYLYKKPILVQRGAFRPVTNVNLDILSNTLKQIRKLRGDSEPEPFSLLEISLSSLTSDGDSKSKTQEELDQDFLERVEAINSVGLTAMISDFKLFYELKNFLRSNSDQAINIVIGASHLEKLFDSSFYTTIQGGLLSGFSRLFDHSTRLFVFPYKSKDSCLTAQSFFPKPDLLHLYKHFIENKYLVDILDCDDVDTSIHSSDVREMLRTKNPRWEKLVPSRVKDLIKKKHFFGYGSK
jgi:hypothetical protein